MTNIIIRPAAASDAPLVLALLRGMFVEDLYVKPQFRGQGLGTRLLATLAARAGDGFLEWQVLDWNTPSIDFYKKLGVALSPEWITCRLEGDALARLA
jgi:GNAT superfamily N-acetyltransferase